MKFLKYQMLEAKNLLCCSTQLNPEILINDLEKISNVFENNSYLRQDATCYLIFDDIKSHTVSLCVPLKEKDLDVNPIFWIKECVFTSAVKARHEGRLSTLRDSLAETQRYLDAQKLFPITPFCCKVLTGLDSIEDTNNMIIDIYVGINLNIH
jgi:hypothetical protein